MAIDGAKIAKNTTYLYLRMLITMGITFYTSRVVLCNLGFTDYGIFSVVGGIAVLFSFLNNSLASSTQRYLTFAIGKGDQNNIAKVFTIAIIVHIFIAAIIVCLSEIIGLWIITHKLDIPVAKLNDAHIVFQCALAISAVSIINVPYTAAIIAEERLNYFAVLGIIETLLKLAIAFLIVMFPDRLTSYSILLLSVSLMVFIATRIYCSIKLPGMKFNFRLWDYTLCKEILSFTGWHMARNGSMIAVSQGNNILVNMFGGAIASAAMGLLTQVTSGVSRFMTSVQAAFSPQITKNFSGSDTQASIKLVLTSSKLSALLFLFICIPLATNMDYVLDLWLDKVPEHTGLFCKFGLVCLLFESLSVPIDTLIMATGKIKRYEIVSSIIWCISLILAYLALTAGLSFKYVLIFRVLAGLTYVIYESYYLKGYINFNMWDYLWNVIVRPISLGIICLAFAILSIYFINSPVVRLIISSFVSTIFLAVFSWWILFNQNERSLIKSMTKKIPVISRFTRK